MLMAKIGISRRGDLVETPYAFTHNTVPWRILGLSCLSRQRVDGKWDDYDVLDCSAASRQNQSCAHLRTLHSSAHRTHVELKIGQIIEGLQHMHSLGLVHGDLKAVC